MSPVLAMVGKTDADAKGLRDRALLLLGFAGAFRRSELVALNVGDLEFCDSGLRVTIRKSKTDQEGLGVTTQSPAVRSLAHLKLCVNGYGPQAYLMELFSGLSQEKERFWLAGCPPEPLLSS
jgi:site-specific recombinase XerC